MSTKNTGANTDAEAGKIPMPTHHMKTTPYQEMTASCLMEEWIHLQNTLWSRQQWPNIVVHIPVYHYHFNYYRQWG
jgi:hypothetical protein